MNQRGTKLLVIILAVCVAGAIVSWVYFNSSAQAPDDASLAKPWYCYHCQKGFLLTPAEYEQTIVSAVHPADEANDTHDMTALVMAVKCPQCGGIAVAAQRCGEHGEIFDPRNPDPKKRYCTQCGPGSDADNR